MITNPEIVHRYCPECQKFTDQKKTIFTNEVSEVTKHICCSCKYDAGTTTKWTKLTH